ncbi:hypothetical protein F4808DRAFT_418897 [Astrocystis sublimbata]|nr:hypothetical protein F4808DRAFT_418897 [Astrocystis sublimbata]
MATNATNIMPASIRGTLGPLSTELLRMIATWCNGQSLLAFTATCRSIRLACHDTVVYRDVIYRTAITKAQGVAITARADSDGIRILARYAVALSSKLDKLPRAGRITCLTASQYEFKILLEKVMDFLPQLLALGYSGACASRIATMAATRPSWTRVGPGMRPVYPRELLLKLAFCFACESTETLGTSQRLREEDETWPPAIHELQSFRDWVLGELEHSSGPVPELEDRVFLYFLLGLMLRSLPEGSPRPPSISHGLAQTLRRAATFLPVPFAERSSWGVWLQRASRMLADDLTLASSEWCGYRTVNPYHLSFGGLVQIQLQVEDRGEDRNVLRGRGHEGTAPFSLEGRVNTYDSRVKMDLIFSSTGRTTCHGFMTPFGVVGYWSYNPESHLLGYFWFWPKGM